MTDEQLDQFDKRWRLHDCWRDIDALIAEVKHLRRSMQDYGVTHQITTRPVNGDVND